MGIENVKNAIGDYAKDIRLNLGAVLSEDGAPGLTPRQIWGIALASAYATKDEALARVILEETAQVLGDTERQAARSAASLMAMNNAYYRFVHLCEDKAFQKMPARLRMNVIANPGIPKADFELSCLAVSALSGCGLCMNAHVGEVRKAGVSDEGIQSSVRIAAVMQAAAQALAIARI